MSSVWSGTLRDLRQLASGGTLVEWLTVGFEGVYGRASAAEVESWRNSLPALLAALSNPQFDDLQVIIELQMPIGAERADVVLLGGRPDSRRAYVLELKQWSSVRLDPETLEVLVPNTSPHQHPSIQVLNYRGKLHLFQSRAAAYHLKSAVFLHNLLMSVQVAKVVIE